MSVKLQLGLLIAVLFIVFGSVTNFYVLSDLKTKSVEKLQDDMVENYKVYLKAKKATTFDRTRLVSSFATTPDIVETMIRPAETPEDIKKNRLDLFEKVEILSRTKFKADLYIVTDDQGNEVTRSGTAKWKPNKFGNRKLIQEALSGISNEDIWSDPEIGGIASFVTAAPIINAGKIIGALLMVNKFGEAVVKGERNLVAGDFGFFDGTEVNWSTLSSTRHGALNRYFQANREKTAKILLERKDVYDIVEVQLGEDEYKVLIAPLQSLEDKNVAGFLLTRNATLARTPFEMATTVIWGLVFGFLVLGVVVSGLMVAPLYEAINFVLEGAHKIIVGDKDYQFSSEDRYLNSLGETLNLMIAILLGKYIPEDEDEFGQVSATKGRSGTYPAAGAVMIETMSEGEEEDQSDGPQESEEDYYDRVFKEFVQAKVAAGDDVSMVTREKMIAKLQKTEQKLIEKHGCKSVRFTVKTENSKVTLKPSPVWKE